ncbi:hypothetical protein MC885_008209 [Smutsia gigantea]|nr:hypothetical protein MC885_008209 [Smutsia gigantea]
MHHQTSAPGIGNFLPNRTHSPLEVRVTGTGAVDREMLRVPVAVFSASQYSGLYLTNSRGLLSRGRPLSPTAPNLMKLSFLDHFFAAIPFAYTLGSLNDLEELILPIGDGIHRVAKLIIQQCQPLRFLPLIQTWLNDLAEEYQLNENDFNKRAKHKHSAAGITTLVERRFTCSFGFSICPLSFLALGLGLLPFSTALTHPFARCWLQPRGWGGGQGLVLRPAVARGEAAQHCGARHAVCAPEPGAAGVAAPTGILVRLLAAAVAVLTVPAGVSHHVARRGRPGGFCIACIFSRFTFHFSRKPVVLPAQ